jgi:hypothetical protein
MVAPQGASPFCLGEMGLPEGSREIGAKSGVGRAGREGSEGRAVECGMQDKRSGTREWYVLVEMGKPEVEDCVGDDSFVPFSQVIVRLVRTSMMQWCCC